MWSSLREGTCHAKWIKYIQAVIVVSKDVNNTWPIESVIAVGAVLLTDDDAYTVSTLIKFTYALAEVLFSQTGSYNYVCYIK